MGNYKELLKHINTFIFDYDGVLTDGSVIMTSNGEAYRISSVKDGYALQLAKKKGYKVAVISGANSESMALRMKALQISDVFLGIEKKHTVFREYLKKNNLQPSQVLFMGDDIPDYEVMLEAGVPTCPADAAEEIKSVAKYISHFGGGKGCVRDVIEQVLKVQGKWMNDDAYHW
ncbi:MAG: HAD-IIIA family hydrolase [Bacteroidales bacterium]|jgi:3-deoxy-D-manno-octulosonate 8-phosphate phosphatase (KDO 8-P phosphatase)|nr:HAD-IIIA family hydrolase [Bacteroidales bacterium]